MALMSAAESLRTGRLVMGLFQTLSAGKRVHVAGLPVGDAVGEAVGLAVGDAVGLAVGVAVGDAVAVGVGLGDFVGCGRPFPPGAAIVRLGNNRARASTATASAAGTRTVLPSTGDG
jgi:hypothetical protein